MAGRRTMLRSTCSGAASSQVTIRVIPRLEMTVGDAKSYSIEVGQRGAGTYSAEDLNRRYWQVATTVGD